MKRLIGVIILCVAVALAVTVGQRMSTDAMAVAIGVVFGVAASIPTSLLVVAATRGNNRSRDHTERERYPELRPPQQPTIIYVNGQPPQSLPVEPDRRWHGGPESQELAMIEDPPQSANYRIVR